jgi:hypothetical protein
METTMLSDMEKLKGLICNLPFQLTMMEDDSIEYKTLVSYSQEGKREKGVYFVSLGKKNEKY